jgi:2-oxoacid:acceptor oxidoreductase gamma subunit (pyruvate/2-ketoisovalerate family)
MIEIRIHGTGGQGVVVAGKFLTDAAAKSNFYVQSFAAYGAERRGGKVTSYVRISREPIHIHSKMYAPDYVVLMEESLVEDTECIAGLKGGGRLLINSARPPETFLGFSDVSVATIDANGVAAKHSVQLPSGMPIINTTLLGALVGTLPDIALDHLIEAFKEVNVPELKNNIAAATEAFNQISVKRKTSHPTKEEHLQIDEQRCPEYGYLVPPCENACPAGHVIHKTLALVQKNRFDDALENIKMENPFPGICGRVCFHPCETSCNAKDVTEPLAINALERAVFDHADKNRLKNPKKQKPTGKKVAVIGSGPAGMTCAYFLARLRHDTIVFEAQAFPGGIPRMGIPAYRLPQKVVDEEVQQILELGVSIKTNTRVGTDITFESILETHDACFIATGAHRSIHLNIPGEEWDGVFSGLALLKRVASGDAVNFNGTKIAVIGGGNTAVDTARSAIRLGAAKVVIVYRRTVEQMPAFAQERKSAEQEGIEIRYLTAPVAIHHGQGQITRLECLKTQLGKPGADGRRYPKIIEGTNFMLEVDHVITAVGETPDISYLSDRVQTEGPLIKVDALGRTSIPGVYAGGDLTNITWSVAEAIGSGKRAAIGIDLFLRNADTQSIVAAMDKTTSGAISISRYMAGGNPVVDAREATVEDLNLQYFLKSPRTHSSTLEIRRRIGNFDEVDTGLTKQNAVTEAARCFHCGNCNLCGTCYILCPDAAIEYDKSFSELMIDSKLCKNCRICINECPRGVITSQGAAR